MATLTKARIVENLLAKNLFTKAESAQIIETLFELLKQSLEEGDDVLISGFGKFCVHEKNRRKGRNPQSGEPIMLGPRKQSNQQITKVPRAHNGCKSRSRSYRTNTLFQQ